MKKAFSILLTVLLVGTAFISCDFEIDAGPSRVKTVETYMFVNGVATLSYSQSYDYYSSKLQKVHFKLASESSKELFYFFYNGSVIEEVLNTQASVNKDNGYQFNYTDPSGAQLASIEEIVDGNLKNPPKYVVSALAYNSTSKLLSTYKNSSGQTYTVTRDSAKGNRITKVASTAAGISHEYTYNAAGQVVAMKFKSAFVEADNAYTYDDLGRVESVTQTYKGSTAPTFKWVYIWESGSSNIDFMNLEHGILNRMFGNSAFSMMY